MPNENELMKRETAESLIGRKWSELSKKEEQARLKNLISVDMDSVDENGHCIIEFSNSSLRIKGYFHDIIDDIAEPIQNATIYSDVDLDEFYRQNEIQQQPSKSSLSEKISDCQQKAERQNAEKAAEKAQTQEQQKNRSGRDDR